MKVEFNIDVELKYLGHMEGTQEIALKLEMFKAILEILKFKKSLILYWQPFALFGSTGKKNSPFAIPGRFRAVVTPIWKKIREGVSSEKLHQWETCVRETSGLSETLKVSM